MSMILAFAACSLVAVLHSARPKLEESHDAATERMKVLHSPSFSLHGHGELHKMNQTSANSDSLGIQNHSKSHAATKLDADETENGPLPTMETSELDSEESDFRSEERELARAGQSQHNVVGRERQNAGIGLLGLPKPRQRRNAIDIPRNLQEDPAVPSDCEDLKNSQSILQSGLRSLCIEIANFQTGYHNKNEMMALKTDEKIDNWLRAAASLHEEQEEFQRITEHYKRGMRNNIDLATQVLQSHPKWGVGTDEAPKPLVGPKERQLPINLPEQYIRTAFGHDSLHNKMHQWDSGLKPSVPLATGLGLPGALKFNHLNGHGNLLGALTIQDPRVLNTDERAYVALHDGYQRDGSGSIILNPANLDRHDKATSGSHSGASKTRSVRDVDSENGYDSLDSDLI